HGELLVAAIPKLAGLAIFISNEVGLGIVPDTELGRRFRDAQGRLNQGVAMACDAVVLVAAGLPLLLKPAPEKARKP
ncbi:MAG: bifunctional adenosylcobinamide kinase/adenosylcobinamide-phosphate guanylyltransferase, partial [Methylovirgula sp.]